MTFLGRAECGHYEDVCRYAHENVQYKYSSVKVTFKSSVQNVSLIADQNILATGYNLNTDLLSNTTWDKSCKHPSLPWPLSVLRTRTLSRHAIRLRPISRFRKEKRKKPLVMVIGARFAQKTANEARHNMMNYMEVHTQSLWGVFETCRDLSFRALRQC